MAITAYVGLPGSGKSYGVVENVILPALVKGRRIFTNIPLNMELIEAEHPALVTEYNTKDIIDNPEWFQTVFEAGATLVIDECWRLWAGGLKANNMNEAHKSFLAEHRHMVGTDGNSTEIVFVTQDLSQMASYPRNLVETTYRAVKLNAVGQSDRFRIDIYQGAVTGPKPPESSRLRQMYSKYSPDIYKYYTSQTMSESDGHGSEESTDKRTNILNSKLLKIGFPVLVCVMGYVIYLGVSDVSSMYGDPEADQGVTADAPASAGKPAKAQKLVNHFYEGLTAHIIYSTGREGFRKYRLRFSDDQRSVTLDADTLGKLGYSWVAFDQCYGQIRSPDAVLHVMCKPTDAVDEIEQAPDPFRTVGL